MTNELKKECGLGMYWCNTDKVCKPIQEDAPVNNVGDGKVAGLGVGQQGEPGVKKMTKNKIIPFKMFVRKQ